MNNCIYIFLCKNNRYYVGSTVDLVDRFKRHIFGRVKSTKHIRPLVLVFHQSYLTLLEARRSENWLKRQKDKKLIKQIIRQGRINKNFG